MSSTTRTTGLSSAAAVTVFRKASASRSGVSSGDHSTGFGTPGKTRTISVLIRVSSLSASGSAPPIARCAASCLTSSPSTANGSSRSASYACARATTAPSIWQLDTNALVRVVLPTPGSLVTTTMRGLLRRASSHASNNTLNSRSRPMSVSGSKRRATRRGGGPATAGGARDGRAGRRAASVAQQIRHADQIGAGLRSQLVGELRFIARKGFQRAAAIARPGPRFHNAADPLLGERVELLQPGGAPLHGGEVADATRGVHLADEAVAHLRNETRPILLLPLLERTGRRNVERVEERAVDGARALPQAARVDTHPSRRKTNGRTLDHYGLARDLGFDDGQTLGQRMISEPRRRAGPQAVGQVVPRELLAGLECQTSEQSEMLARAEPHLLARLGEQGGTTQTMQRKSVRHGDTAF